MLINSKIILFAYILAFFFAVRLRFNRVFDDEYWCLLFFQMINKEFFDYGYCDPILEGLVWFCFHCVKESCKNFWTTSFKTLFPCCHNRCFWNFAFYLKSSDFQILQQIFNQYSCIFINVILWKYYIWNIFYEHKSFHSVNLRNFKKFMIILNNWCFL